MSNIHTAVESSNSPNFHTANFRLIQWALAVPIPVRAVFAESVRTVLMFLVAHVGLDTSKDNLMRCWYPAKKIAQITGLPLRTVQRALKWLHEAKVINYGRYGRKEKPGNVIMLRCEDATCTYESNKRRAEKPKKSNRQLALRTSDVSKRQLALGTSDVSTEINRKELPCNIADEANTRPETHRQYTEQERYDLERGKAYLLNARTGGGPLPITDRYGKNQGGWIHRELRLDPCRFMAAIEEMERIKKLPPGKQLYAPLIWTVARNVKDDREAGTEYEAYTAQQQQPEQEYPDVEPHAAIREPRDPMPLGVLTEEVISQINVQDT